MIGPFVGPFITDPVTGHPVTASCAGIFAAVAQLYVDWFNQDNPAQ